MRTFIAIDMSPEVKFALQAVIRDIRRGASGVKWVEPGAMHLTLKFLGEIPDTAVAQVKGVLERVSSGRSPFILRLRGTGTFPPGGRRNARVLWVGSADEPQLLDLQADLESGLEEQGFPREDRPFHPHLTLGRVKTPEGLERALRGLERHARDEIGAMSVARLTLFQSVLGPGGPEYAPVLEQELG